MMSLKHVVAAVAVGAALMFAPVAADAAAVHGRTHAKHVIHHVSKKKTPAKKGHKQVVKKHTSKTTHVAKTGARGWKHHRNV